MKTRPYSPRTTNSANLFNTVEYLAIAEAQTKWSEFEMKASEAILST